MKLIHYINFDEVGSMLQEVDPCEDLTDDDIRTAIQNATGPRSALFVPEVGLSVVISVFLLNILPRNFLFFLSLVFLVFFLVTFMD